MTGMRWCDVVIRSRGRTQSDSALRREPRRWRVALGNKVGANQGLVFHMVPPPPPTSTPESQDLDDESERTSDRLDRRTSALAWDGLQIGVSR